MNLKKYLPQNLKLFMKVNLRKLKDRYSAQRKLFNSREKFNQKFTHSISIVQEIKKGQNFENKIHNLQKGISSIEDIVLHPGEIFSFWHNVGKPTQKNGFLLSRNIVSGEVSEDYGGGLCQLSSIIYHLSLITGLEIIERFNHSIDIYKEEDRFTPLGSDATVVYGYKDLRIRNNFHFPISFSTSVNCGKLECTFSSNEHISEHSIDFQRKDLGDRTEVSTLKHLDGELILVTKSVYKIEKIRY